MKHKRVDEEIALGKKALCSALSTAVSTRHDFEFFSRTH
jgi:hypothetical protein